MRQFNTKKTVDRFISQCVRAINHAVVKLKQNKTDGRGWMCRYVCFVKGTGTTELSTLSLRAALPIEDGGCRRDQHMLAKAFRPHRADRIGFSMKVVSTTGMSPADGIR